MSKFPRTMVGGVSLPRLIIGTNWFLGFSHISLAKDKFIKSYMTQKRVSRILQAFMKAGVDAIMAPLLISDFNEAIEDAEQKTGIKLIKILTPHFNIKPGGQKDLEPEAVIEKCRKDGAVFCLPHQMVTDALIDRRDMIIRDIDTYTSIIRKYGMVPGLSTHSMEAVTYADQQDADIDTYIQIYNAAGFLMQAEPDWLMRIINQAKKPVMTIKPLAAGRLIPHVGLSFVWSTIREQDMVTISATTPDEAREVIEISLSFINRRIPTIEIQKTRSKNSLNLPCWGDSFRHCE